MRVTNKVAGLTVILLFVNFVSIAHASSPSRQNLSIAIIKPTFTAAAYNKAFYVFYAAHDASSSSVKNVTTDLKLLTAKIPSSSGAYRVLQITDQLKHLLPGTNIQMLTDSDVNDGNIFEKTNGTDNTSNVYDILILGHQEYVTQQEYDNLKKFVANGGTIFFLDGNVFYAEVNYDKSAKTVTLIKGHGWAFNGQSAWESVNERWKNETSQWVGSNFYYWGGINYNITFTNIPFHYKHFEEQYISNTNAKIILNYGAIAPTYKIVNGTIFKFGYPKPLIAAYAMNYQKGKVISLGIYSDTIINQSDFIKFVNGLLLKYVIERNNSTRMGTNGLTV